MLILSYGIIVVFVASVCLLTLFHSTQTHTCNCFIVLSTICSPKKQKKLIKIKEPSYHQALDKVFIDQQLHHTYLLHASSS